jgi:hypothetical protein
MKLLEKQVEINGAKIYEDYKGTAVTDLHVMEEALIRW